MTPERGDAGERERLASGMPVTREHLDGVAKAELVEELSAAKRAGKR